MGAFTFGGGYAILPVMEKELVEKRKWTTEEELLDYYAIGQSTPGIIAINTSTFVGYKMAGIPGALAATLGMISPSLIIISLIAAFLNAYDENPVVQKALKGVNIAVTVLLVTSVKKFALKSISDRIGLILCLAAFSLVAFAGWSPIGIIVLSALTGVLLHVIRQRRSCR